MVITPSSVSSTHTRFAKAYTKEADKWLDITKGGTHAPIVGVNEIKQGAAASETKVALTFSTVIAQTESGQELQRRVIDNQPLVLTGHEADSFLKAEPVVWTHREAERITPTPKNGKKALLAQWFEGLVTFTGRIDISQKPKLEDVLS